MQKPLDPMSVERTETPSASYVLRRRYGPARHVITVASWVTVISMLLQPVAVFAATVNWDGSDSAAWDTGANWDGNAKPGSSDDAVFPASVPGTGSTITLGSGETALSLTFNNSYTLSGGTLTIGGSGSGSISVSSDKTATISGQITGTSTITKAGTGTVRITDANTNVPANQTFTLSDGTLKLVGTAQEPVKAANPLLWLDANDANTLTKPGDVVSSWTSKGTYTGSVTQSDSAMQPTWVASGINSKGSVRFDGSTTGISGDANRDALKNTGLLTTSNFSANQATTFVVFKPDSDNYYSVTGTGSAGDGLWCYTSPQSCYAADFRSARLAGPFAMPSTGSHIWNMSSGTGSGTYKVWLDGTLMYTTDPAFGFASDFWVGTGNLDRPLKGDIAEILIYNTALSEADRTATYNYLNYKWFNVAAIFLVNLPSSHVNTTGSSTLDLDSASLDHTLGKFSVAGDATLTIANANSVTLAGIGGTSITATGTGTATITGTATLYPKANITASGASLSIGPAVVINGTDTRTQSVTGTVTMGNLSVSNPNVTFTVNSGASVSSASVSNGNVTLNNANTMSSLAVSGGNVTIANQTITSATVSGTGVLSLPGGSTANLQTLSYGSTAGAGLTIPATASAGGTGGVSVSNGNVTLNNANTMSSLALSGGTITLGNGAKVADGYTVKPTGGTLRVADSSSAVATVGTADFSNYVSNNYTVNTQAGALGVNTVLNLPGGITATPNTTGIFKVSSVSGSNIADRDAAKTFTLSGGILTLNAPGTVNNEGTGGTITTSGGTVFHTFLSSGTLNDVPATTAQILVVGGGGGGGGRVGGGGGAGGVVYVSGYSLTSGSKTVTVGEGGNYGTGHTQAGYNGENSVFDPVGGAGITITALGGGGAASYNGQAAKTGGGSGGGGAYTATSPGSANQTNSGIAGALFYGNNGGNAASSGNGGAGGGGAGAPGVNSTSSAPTDGGIGIQFSQYTGLIPSTVSTTSDGWFAGGGGGGATGTQGATAGLGGRGGGANGTYGANTAAGVSPDGLANTGGGGGGAPDNNNSGHGGKGGKGVVIVSYPATYSPGVVNLPNTHIAATSSSTLDLGASGENHTLGNVTVTAGASADTTLTVNNANSLTIGTLTIGINGVHYGKLNLGTKGLTLGNGSVPKLAVTSVSPSVQECCVAVAAAGSFTGLHGTQVAEVGYRQWKVEVRNGGTELWLVAVLDGTVIMFR